MVLPILLDEGVARKLRVEYSGTIYHVINRGDHRDTIFKDGEDRRRFVETLGEACGKTGWRFHAYVLMGRHYHLLVEPPEANLVARLKLELPPQPPPRIMAAADTANQPM